MALGLLRGTHQVDLLKSLRDVKTRAGEEARHQKDALTERLELARIKEQHYDGLAFMGPLEIAGCMQNLGERAPIE